MTDQENRLARLEAEFDQFRPSLHARLEQLEKSAKKPNKTGLARLLDWMGPALPQLIGSAVMLVIAFWVKDSVDIAIKHQQLQLSYAKEMKEQLAVIASSDATLADVERAAVVVATYGRPAVMPLMNELRYSGNRALGAEAGLRSLALLDPEAVCETVPRVVSSRAKMLGWEGQMLSARILAAGNCSEALPTLNEHKRLLLKVRAGEAQSESLSNLVNDTPDVIQQKQWLQSLEQTIAILSDSRR